ncbi:MAG: hypothetical protein AB7T07_11155 [Steroidobacteraceae bacterium]
MSNLIRVTMRRRQVFGVVLILVAVALLILAVWGHVRRLSYVAAVIGGAGVWMLSRRS